ncbi:SRPBCC family protein [Chitinophaga sp. 22321]|uniref:SRPBCC domain-containing protein n=1 Tax=Chitinophaga hostae TaxID=2831022 RepID=A0ABS5J5P3_9BACT|nr:SRPBCC domain-containing protein [Chitinophaga hostae]MBS0030388.1 SRPBCC domain-containing protein [Chitinophaga hostae]
MSYNLAFDFSVDKENKTIRVTREFAATLPLVWDAYTKSDILDRWWAPKPWRAKTKTMDFRNGGRWHYAMVGPEGEEHWALAEYLDIQVHKTFALLDAFADADGNTNKDLPQSKWVVTFIDKGAVTLVESVITYADLAQLEATIKMGFKEGLAMAMENLDELFAASK